MASLSTDKSERAERHKDCFLPKDAVTYLGLQTEDALAKLRELGLLQGYKVATQYYIYHRDDLDRCFEKMCGRDPDKGQAPLKQLRLAQQQGGR